MILYVIMSSLVTTGLFCQSFWAGHQENINIDEDIITHRDTYYTDGWGVQQPYSIQITRAASKHPFFTIYLYCWQHFVTTYPWGRFK